METWSYPLKDSILDLQIERFTNSVYFVLKVISYKIKKILLVESITVCYIQFIYTIINFVLKTVSNN